jgi:zinc transport system substrate-binding protein
VIVTRAGRDCTTRSGTTRSRWIALLLAALIAAGCRPAPSGSGQMLVIATFYPLYEFTARIGGGRVDARSLVPAGVEPHDYEPTPKDVVALKQARVLIYNGSGFEPWVQRLLPEVAASTVQVDATRGLPLIPGGPGGDRPGAGPALDPHVWLDPVLAAQQADRIVAGLTEADPAGLAVYAANGERLKAELDALHRRYASALSSCRRRGFIVSHAAFGYLARRYGLTQVPISGLQPESEPSPARMKEIVLEARRTGARVIYYETLVDPRVADAIAREIGARVAVLDPVEGIAPEDLRQGANYFTLMEANLRALADGLDCPQ